MLQLLAKHRMPAYRERVCSLIRVSAPQLLPGASESSDEPPQISLTSELGPPIQAKRAKIRVPMLPPPSTDSPVDAASAAVGPPTGVSTSRWQLPPPFSRSAGRLQRVSIEVSVEGACLDTVTSAQISSQQGELWQGRIAERPAAPPLAVAEFDDSERADEHQRSWAQWMMGLMAGRQRSPAADAPSMVRSEALQVLRVHATLPFETARSLVDQLSRLDVRLCSDFAEVPVMLELQPRRVWLIAEDPQDALAFLTQLPVQTSDAASAKLSVLMDGRRTQHEDVHAGVRSTGPLSWPSGPANVQEAFSSGMSLRRLVAAAAELQQRASAGLAGRRQSKSIELPLSAYGYGVQYDAVLQPQPESLEARLRSDTAALRQQHPKEVQQDIAGVIGQVTRLIGKVRGPAAPFPVQRRSMPDAVLILLQSAELAGSGAASSSLVGSLRSSSRSMALKQLITAAASGTVPVLIVLSGASPWSPLMGADLTVWARSGASVLHVKSLCGCPERPADGAYLIQHAVYRLVAGNTKSMMLLQSKL